MAAEAEAPAPKPSFASGLICGSTWPRLACHPVIAALLDSVAICVSYRERMQFTRLAVLSLALSQAGCSWIFTQGPPPADRESPVYYDCSTSYAPPVLDTIWGGLNALGAISALASSDEKTSQNRGAVVGVGLAWVVISGLSAYYGYSKVSECHEFKDEHRVPDEHDSPRGYWGSRPDGRPTWSPPPRGAPPARLAPPAPAADPASPTPAPLAPPPETAPPQKTNGEPASGLRLEAGRLALRF